MEIDAEIEKLFSRKFPITYYERSNKVEHGNMNFSLYEIMIQGKPADGKIKTDRTIAYPEISSIVISSEEKIIFDLSEKNCQITIKVEEPLYVIKCIFIAFKLFFPFEDVFSFLTIKNESSLPLYAVKKEVQELNVATQSPCNNFSLGVKFFAKYKYLPENEEIIWDIDTVYANKGTNMFTLKDFDHLKPKYLFPVLGAMCYNTYFTELSLNCVDLAPYEKLLERLFKSNKKFKKLSFDSCNIKLSLCTSIASGLECQSSLKFLDLSNNEGVGDKGVEIFSPFLKKSSHILEVLKMSKCNLSSISVCKIADAFTHNIKGNEENFIQLRILDLSNNQLKDNFKDIFYDFLSKCCHLEDLNLANMNCSIEMMYGCLQLGPVKTLKYLDLSENISPVSSQSCTQWSTFFREAKSLKRINLSNFKSLNRSITEGLMFGLESNSTLLLTGVEVVISNSCFNTDNFTCFSDFIYKAKSVTNLDISSNGLGIEFQSLLNKLPEFSSLKSLNISNNFSGLKQKDQQIILSQMSDALQLESVNLQELYMSNCNFGSNLSAFVSELDSLFSLRVLDISGNNIGNIVARTVGRMLTIDKHIKEINLDNNNISKEIYEEILNGLAGNYTLCVFHVPFADLVKYPPKQVIPIIEKINKHHKKVDKIYQGISFEDIKAMAFSCIMNQTSENIDKCKNALQESCNRLKGINANDESVKNQIIKCLSMSLENIKSMDASKDLIVKLNTIYKDNDNELLLTDLRIKRVIEHVTSDVLTLINEYMEEIVNEMINETRKTLPYLLNNNELFKLELSESCRKVMEIPKEYLSKLFTRFIEKNLLKKVYETQSNVSNALNDCVTDYIITQMNTCDIQANRLISLSKSILLRETSPEKHGDSDTFDQPIIRVADDKKIERDKMNNVRTSRLSHLAASKARPLSKALKPLADQLENQAPPKPIKPTRLKPVGLKPTNMNYSPSPDDPMSPDSATFKQLTPDSPRIVPLTPDSPRIIPKTPDSPNAKSLYPDILSPKPIISDFDSIKPVAPSRVKRLLPVSETNNDSSCNEESINVKISNNQTPVLKDMVTKQPKSTNDTADLQDKKSDSFKIPSFLKTQDSIRKDPKAKITKTIIDSLSSQDSITDNNDFLVSLKGRPKRTKNFKATLLSPDVVCEEGSAMSENKLHNFHNLTELDVDIVVKAPSKKKSFFSLSKTKSAKNKAIDLNDLGKEALSSSDSEAEEKRSNKGLYKKNSIDRFKKKHGGR